MSDGVIVVGGGGGFIGGHLVANLVREGRSVRAVDIKPMSAWYQVVPGAESVVADLKDLTSCRTAVDGAGTVYQLAADMGGMGFIEQNKALCMLSVLTNTHMLMAAKDAGVERFFFSSSACVITAPVSTLRVSTTGVSLVTVTAATTEETFIASVNSVLRPTLTTTFSRRIDTKPVSSSFTAYVPGERFRNRN